MFQSIKILILILFFNIKPGFGHANLSKFTYYSYQDINLTKTAVVQTGDSIKPLEQTYSKHQNWHKLSDLYYHIAKNYYKTKNYDLAVSYYLKIDSIAKVHNLLSETTVRAIFDRSAISKLQFTHDAVEMADDLSREALKKSFKLNNPKLTAEIKLLLSEILFLKGQPDEALKYLHESEAYFRKTNDAKHMARVFLLYKEHFKNDLKNFKKTDSVLQAGIQYLQNKSQNKDLADLHIFYGDFLLYDLQTNPQKALRHYLVADSLYYQKDSIPSLHRIYLLEGLSDAYKKLGQYQKALFFKQKAYNLRKELYRRQNKNLSRRLETRYQAQQKQAQLVYQQQQNDMLKKQKNRQKIFFGILSLLLFLLGLLLYFQYRNRQKVIKKLRELDKAKSDFFANISHEFRTPLTLILSPVKQRLQQNDLNKEDRNLLQIVQHNAERLLDLVNQVLDLTKLQAGKRKLRVSPVNPQDFLGLIAHNFESLAQQKNITYQIENQCQRDEIWIDKEIIKKITNNLLSNSFKYTEQGGHVKFKSECKDGKLIIKMQNTGKKLTQEDLNRIYERFYQKNQHSEGIGLGLSIVKQLVQLHKGSIKAESNDSGWTTFQVMIPIEKKAYKSGEIAKQTEPEKINKPVNLESEKSPQSGHCPIDQKDDPLLLIIEDNEAVRKYIANIFKDCFKVITAKDGMEGLEKGFANIPDIIISDVMMPGKDGMEVLTAFKSCERTNHIPVILLTAKAGEENKIKALTNGADDYIEKPFNEEILKIKVSNLLKSRQRIKEKILNEYLFVGNIPKDIPDKDQQFFAHLTKVLEQNLTKPDFSAEDFADAMGMSRMQLHRKLKALTGQSASQFINIQRLNQAARLLRETDANISEIAYSVGFNDPGYFNKCFKKQFGKTASEFKKNNT